MKWGSKDRFSGKTVEEWIQYDLDAYQALGANRPFARSMQDGIAWQKNNLSQNAFARETSHVTQTERVDKMRIAKLLRPLGATLLMFLATSCAPKKDAQKKLPDDVARDFVSSVLAGDFEAARSYWSPGSVATIEEFSKMPFKDFCLTRFDCSEFLVEPAVRQKGDYWSVVYRSNCDGVSTSYVFYVKAIDEVYCLTCERWKAPSSEE